MRIGINLEFLLKVPINSDMYYRGRMKEQIEKEAKRNPGFRV